MIDFAPRRCFDLNFLLNRVIGINRSQAIRIPEFIIKREIVSSARAYRTDFRQICHIIPFSFIVNIETAVGKKAIFGKQEFIIETIEVSRGRKKIPTFLSSIVSTFGILAVTVDNKCGTVAVKTVNTPAGDI